jgi:hypothetical protein
MLAPESATTFLNGFLSWRSVHPAGWMEVGLRVFDLLGTDFRDAPGLSRNPGGGQVGGEELDRRATLFVRGGF